MRLSVASLTCFQVEKEVQRHKAEETREGVARDEKFSQFLYISEM